jgi:hypothetical protein
MKLSDISNKTSNASVQNTSLHITAVLHVVATFFDQLTYSVNILFPAVVAVIISLDDSFICFLDQRERERERKLLYLL